jgi:hypothetical protein
MRLTLTDLELAGVYSHSLSTWHDHLDTQCTQDIFTPHFVHGENSSAPLPPTNGIPVDAQVVNPQYTYNNVSLGYCWTYGLTKNPKHIMQYVNYCITT